MHLNWETRCRVATFWVEEPCFSMERCTALQRSVKNITSQQEDSCMSKFTEFYDIFYSRLNQIHGSDSKCQLLTKSIHHKSEFLVTTIKLCLDMAQEALLGMDDQDLLKLVRARVCGLHDGVTAFHYVGIGESLFYALSRCDAGHWQLEVVSRAWTHAYSLAMRALLPLALERRTLDSGRSSDKEGTTTRRKTEKLRQRSLSAAKKLFVEFSASIRNIEWMTCGSLPVSSPVEQRRWTSFLSPSLPTRKKASAPFLVPNKCSECLSPILGLRIPRSSSCQHTSTTRYPVSLVQTDFRCVSSKRKFRRNRSHRSSGQHSDTPSSDNENQTSQSPLIRSRNSSRSPVRSRNTQRTGSRSRDTPRDSETSRHTCQSPGRRSRREQMKSPRARCRKCMKAEYREYSRSSSNSSLSNAPVLFTRRSYDVPTPPTPCHLQLRAHTRQIRSRSAHASRNRGQVCYTSDPELWGATKQSPPHPSHNTIKSPLSRHRKTLSRMIQHLVPRKRSTRDHSRSRRVEVTQSRSPPPPPSASDSASDSTTSEKSEKLTILEAVQLAFPQDSSEFSVQSVRSATLPRSFFKNSVSRTNQSTDPRSRPPTRDRNYYDHTDCDESPPAPPNAPRLSRRVRDNRTNTSGKHSYQRVRGRPVEDKFQKPNSTYQSNTYPIVSEEIFTDPSEAMAERFARLKARWQRGFQADSDSDHCGHSVRSPVLHLRADYADSVSESWSRHEFVKHRENMMVQQVVCQ
eukprot:221342_1